MSFGSGDVLYWDMGRVRKGYDCRRTVHKVLGVRVDEGGGRVASIF